VIVHCETGKSPQILKISGKAAHNDVRQSALFEKAQEVVGVETRIGVPNPSLNISQVFQTCEIFTRASRLGSGLPGRKLSRLAPIRRGGSALRAHFSPDVRNAG
jgi:hypothetical protein